MALGSCSRDGCPGKIQVPNVQKEVEIPKSPQFVALVYECSECGNHDKFVASYDDWAAAQKQYAKRGRDFRRHQIELDAIDTAHDLISLWASLKNPPLIEEVRYACKCTQCEEKWNGKRI